MGWTVAATPVRKTERVVVIVDDDDDVRSAMDSLFRSIGLRTMLFASAHELIEAALPRGPCCLVVDVLLPELSGLELPERLAERGIRIPFVFVTGYGDVPMTVRAMKAAAVDVLTKPVREQELIDAVAGGLIQHRRQLGEADTIAVLRAAYASLTVREREVVALVVEGLMNKQIAGHLELCVVPVRSIQVATEPLPEALRARLMPGGHHGSDTQRLLKYFRLPPEGRFVIGGRGRLSSVAATADLAALHRDAERLIADLAGLRWEHAWGGFVAITMDHYPHMHLVEPRILVVQGFNGRGVALTTTLGGPLAD